MKKRGLIYAGVIAAGMLTAFIFLAPQPAGLCVGDPDPVFPIFPTAIENITHISPPIMRVGSGVKSHSYINVKKPSAVYAPADATLIGGAKYTEGYVDATKIQYTFLLQAGCDVSYYVDHLINPPARIAALFPDPPTTHTHSNDRFNLEIKAGQLLGYNWSGQFDFGVLNRSKEPPLKDFDEYRHSEKAYADCPLNYFENKEKLMSLVSYQNMGDLTVIDNLCD